MPKLESMRPDRGFAKHDYGNLVFRQPCGDSERLVIGTSGSNVKLLDVLAQGFRRQEYFILYVLLLSHSGRRPGRYQSPLLASHGDLQLFLWTFQEFFEGDGRHHVWVASPGSQDVLVYDQHDVIFSYGALDEFENTLIAQGLTRGDFWFPAPHRHAFEPRNASVEDALMKYFDWQYFELQPQDEWD